MARTLPADALTLDPDVVTAVASAKASVAARRVSDLVDAAGHQYVDLVMEGGGVLGVALAGYTYALESAGIRFLGLGGTSAGSINALVIAALGPPHVAKGRRVAEIVANVPMASFIDGDGDARDFTDAIVDGAGKFKLALKGAQVVDNFTEDLGLHPGRKFRAWLSEQLAVNGIATLADLQAMQAVPPPGGYRVLPSEERMHPSQHRTAEQDASTESIRGRLAVIAADITTGTKVEFPRMASLYWADPAALNPADFVRASMSVPAFFHPVRVRGIPQGPAALQRWSELTSYKGARLPKECVFVDGGIISNFPIAVFHNHSKVPRSPTFGVKLGVPAAEPSVIDSPTELLAGVFNAARGALDQDFLAGNPDYRHLISSIDTKKHNWLNFNLSHDAKIDLFREGAKAAAAFLEEFDWASYKRLRLLKAQLRNEDGS
ncbi:MAG: hypothetical protein C0434_09595 [Xanthomonadaceae bacterium]|nr:hypothetical protein [Xanthomonadaceae bacterium]